MAWKIDHVELGQSQRSTWETWCFQWNWRKKKKWWNTISIQFVAPFFLSYYSHWQ